MATHQLNRNDPSEQTRNKKDGTEATDASTAASEPRGRNDDPARARDAKAPASSNPFVLMRRMVEDVDRVLDNLGFGFPGFSSPGGIGFFGARWSPGLDVFQRDGNLIVRADLPGMTQDDIHIEVEGGNTLVLRGERKNEQRETSSDSVWRTERSYGAFRRTMRLPRGIDIDQASARFDNGVLEISLAMPAEHQTRRIAIKTSSDAPEKAGSPPKGGTSPVH